MSNAQLPPDIKLPFYFRDIYPVERSGRFEVWGYIGTDHIIQIMTVKESALSFRPIKIVDGFIPFTIELAGFWPNIRKITKGQYETAVKTELKRINGRTR